MENLTDIITQFDFKGDYVNCELFGSGHINTTYLVTYNNNGVECKYVFLCGYARFISQEELDRKIFINI